MAPENVLVENCLDRKTTRRKFWQEFKFLEFSTKFYGSFFRILKFAFLDRRNYKFTFEETFEPILTEEYDIDYAFNTLLLKMYTDWPECTAAEFTIDLYDVILCFLMLNLYAYYF